MGYVTADTNPKVGYRPYAETDPFRASHLSGIGEYFYNRPFDPWELHQPGLHGFSGNPFKVQNWRLSGMGDVSDATGQAVEEYVAAGKLDGDQASAIMDGSASFATFNLPDPTDQSSWSTLLGLFQEVNTDLKTLEAAYQAAGQPGGPMAGNAAFIAFGKQLIAYRQQYSQLASQLVQYYTLLTGSTPSGLSGLGFAPIVVWAAGAAIFLITASIALYAIHTWAKSVDLDTMKAQTQQISANTTQSLTQQMAAAQASGDTATAQAIANILQTNANAAATSTQNPTIAWLENNAVWLGLGTIALLFVIPAPSGRRR